MFGLLNVHKPAGVTSRDVVNHVQRLVRPEKAGHAGTLDPLATGVLIVALGKATRLIEYVQQMRKCYVATFELGRTSDTDDCEGTISELPAAPLPTRAALDAALLGFLGEIQQVPPAYSAIKVAGQRAYDRARRGEEVTLAARPVTVYQLTVLGYTYPELRLEIECGSGTYVRSLGRDLARALGTGAIMTALCRTRIGEFALDSAVPMDQLTATNLGDHLRPALDAVAMLPRRQLTNDEARRIANGLSITGGDGEPTASEIAALDDRGRFVAILSSAADGTLRPERNFFDTASDR